MSLGWSAFGNYDSASDPGSVPDLYGIGDDLSGGGQAVGSSIWLRQRRHGESGLYLGASEEAVSYGTQSASGRRAGKETATSVKRGASVVGGCPWVRSLSLRL